MGTHNMNNPELYASCQIAFVDNLWSKMMHFQKAGQKEPGHSHIFNHLTLLAKGKVNVNVDGVDTVFTAPHMIFIAKEKIHEITALEDDTVAYCIHALRVGDDVGDILDMDMVPEGVDPYSLVKPLAKTPSC